jgi:phosphonate transport system substrate-binding protein
MSYVLSVSPDFAPAQIANWFTFNVWLQKELGTAISLRLFDDFDAQHLAIAEDGIDLIYANPFDASLLVRAKRFEAIAAPAGKCDEVVIAVAADSAIECIEDLKPGTRIAVTRDPGVNLIGMIMLEPAELDGATTRTTRLATWVQVMKSLLHGESDAAFFLKDAFDELSQLAKRRMRVLVTSQIGVIRHVLLAGPKAAPIREPLCRALRDMGTAPRGRGILDDFGFPGWEPQGSEDTECMIDLMDSLSG